jgi:threonylcarbamoyladenosine tRNA methylthiotransferase MtaB
MGVEVINFGCRLNLAEGEAMREAAASQDDLIIVNSCIVTAEAERQARQAIRRAAKRRPDARIILTGCGAGARGEQFAAMPEISAILPNAEKTLPATWGTPGASPTPAISGKGHARAFIEVQNGCDHRCTFCIIPYGRGDSRSVPAGGVVDAVKAAMDRGQQEVVLTGVDLTSYGPDLPGASSLGQLVERILTFVPDLPRLRLSSLDGIEIDDRLFDILTSEQRVMPHVHLSLQSGDDMILKRMKRRHSRAQSIDLVTRLKARRPDIAIGADIIAGFPTETEEMFDNSLSLLDACDIVLAHIFPFSPREGTPAAKMPQLQRPVIKERADRLRARAEERRTAWLDAMVGTRQNVLIELDGQTGHADNFAKVALEQPLASGNMRGHMVQVQMLRRDGDRLIGVPA